MTNERTKLAAWLCASLSLTAACGDDDMEYSEQPSTVDPTPPQGAEPNTQTPPQGAAAVEAWLAKGDYKSWHCEPVQHEFRPPSPHGFNRICSNDVVSKNATGTGAWPKGAAAVKELYASTTADTPIGYAVYLKTADDSAAGANWYWYERLPGAAPGDTVVVADGMGSAGGAKAICVACHGAAGSDASHTPSPNGRDQVYTPVL